MNELKFTILESRNLYYINTIIEKVIETQYYYDSIFYKYLANTEDRYIAEDIDSLYKLIIIDINK